MLAPPMNSLPSAPSVVGADAVAVSATPETAKTTAKTTASATLFKDALLRAKASPAGPWVLVAVTAGAIIGIGGAGWAVLIDVPFPLAIMAGYCTLAVSVCLAAALVLLAAPDATPAPVAEKKNTPNYAAWKLVQTFSVSNASRLWCDIEPGSALTQDSIAWAKVLLGAISRGELPMVEKAGVSKDVIERERANPNWHTEVAKDALHAWAKTHGFNPRFLQD